MQRQNCDTYFWVPGLKRKTEPIKKTKMRTKTRTRQQKSKLNVERWLIFMRPKFQLRSKVASKYLWQKYNLKHASRLLLPLLPLHSWKKGRFFFVDGSARIMWNLCQSYHLALVLVLYPCLEPILRVFFWGGFMNGPAIANPWPIWGLLFPAGSGQG